MQGSLNDQRLDALSRANEVRSHRAQVKVDISAGRMLFTDAMTDAMCARMPLVELLLAVPHWGPVKVGRVLRQAHIAPSKLVGDLTERQVSEIRRALQPPSAAGARMLVTA
jgi:hypothetical protein